MYNGEHTYLTLKVYVHIHGTVEKLWKIIGNVHCKKYEGWFNLAWIPQLQGHMMCHTLLPKY